MIMIKESVSVRAAAVFSLSCAMALSSCGKNESGKAKAAVAFKNQTGLSLRSADPTGATTPTIFGMKLVVVYLVENIDATTQNNLGNVARIWVNPKCDETLTQCGIGPSAGSNQVTDYFDFALPTAQVNANLNSQGLEITPGTYRYVRVDFAGPTGANDPSIPNMRFGTSTAYAVRPNFGNGVTRQLDTPITLGEGETATVTLSYDIANSFYPSTSNNAGDPPAGDAIDNWYCANTATNPATGPCIYFTGFTPSATK